MALWYCINVSKNAMAQRFAWGVSGGFLQGIQLLGKDALTIYSVSGSKLPWNQPWLFYVLLPLHLIPAGGGLVLITKCFKRYDATFTAALGTGALVLSSTAVGAVHYNTFSNIRSVSSLVLYPLGLASIMSGLFVLVRHSKKEGTSSGNDDDLDQGSLQITVTTGEHDAESDALEEGSLESGDIEEESLESEIVEQRPIEVTVQVATDGGKD